LQAPTEAEQPGRKVVLLKAISCGVAISSGRRDVHGDQASLPLLCDLPLVLSPFSGMSLLGHASTSWTSNTIVHILLRIYKPEVSHAPVSHPEHVMSCPSPLCSRWHESCCLSLIPINLDFSFCRHTPHYPATENHLG